MNLKFHFLSQLIAIALLSLFTTTTYVLYRSDQQTQHAMQITMDSLSKRISVQSQLIPNQEPDFSLWKQTHNKSGICVNFVSDKNNKTYGFCNGEKFMAFDNTSLFAKLYRWIFRPNLEISKSIVVNNQPYGTLTVSANQDVQIAQAWENVCNFIGLAIVTTIAISFLVFMSVRRTVRPTCAIVDGLERIRKGDLNYRLPLFDIVEWQIISDAVNHLADSQQQLLEDRRQLIVKLMTLQEDERRYLSRELHDEFGQCLAGINAITASVSYTAAEKCPELIDEINQINPITKHMMDSIHSLLARLRPVELDELGLFASLSGLVLDWNNRNSGKVSYQLNIDGDCKNISEIQAVALFRIAQECLTNIAKHSNATQVDISLKNENGNIIFIIKDNGIATTLPFANKSGIGLFGIHERVSALHGEVSFTINKPHGLVVSVSFPITGDES
ncbi:MAG: histidine kinase [Methylococcales bacterium]|nr:histidine kinase [Methylococcales bacterium]